MPSPLLAPALAADPGVRGWQVGLLVVLAAGTVLVATRPVLTRLPEPDEPDGKPPYGALATRRFAVTCALLAGIAATLVGLTLPRPTWPLWWVLSTVVVVLVAVDARTTWLPLALTRAAWAAGAGALAVAWWLGGSALLLRGLVGAAAAGLLYLVLWRLSGRALGFGDVRLAPLLGAAGAAVGWPTLLATLLLGSLVGAVVGLTRILRRRPGSFAYAPSMLAGAFLACLARAVSG